MKSLATSLRSVTKLGLGAILILAIGLALTGESRSAVAAEPTRILLSGSDFLPVESPPGIILFPDGPEIQLYVWVENVVAERGAGTFNLEFSWVSWLLDVDSVAEGDAEDGLLADSEWLTNSASQIVTCSSPAITNDEITGQGSANVGCGILGAPSRPPDPPWGAVGDGILASLRIAPGSALGRTTFTVTAGTWLDDTGEIYDSTGDTIPDTEIPFQDIPIKLLSLPVLIAPCADFTGATPGVPDGIVTIVDILFEASHFGAAPTNPPYEPNWDMDVDSVITIPDILIVARQFGTVCP